MTKNCTFPPELDDKQLLAYLDGEADKEIVSHLQDCVYCREKAEKLDSFQRRLTARLYRHTCPSAMELGEYHLHLLPASQMLVIGRHLRECPDCTLEIAQLESFLSRQATSPEDSLLGRAKVLIVQLIRTQELTYAPTALRGEGKGPITFAADGIIVALDIQPVTGERVNILGQIAADNQSDWTDALVELRNDNQAQISSAVDDLGAFQCEGVIPGQQELRITPKNGVIVIMANFEISA